ncbi:MAG: DedA family protein [Sedimentisphaerales bacterium]|nr:DedA family protein [Sedimentisphaerales bacterium]
MTDPTPVANEPKIAKWHLHRRLYLWVLHWSETRFSGWALFILSFAESSFFPVPPDVLLAPLTLGNRKKWWKFALSCSIASVVGGIFGYAIGIFLWATVGNFFHTTVPGFSRDVITLKDSTQITCLVKPTSVRAQMLGQAQLIDPVVIQNLDDSEQTLSLDQIDLENTKINPFTKVGALYDTHDWKIVAIAGFTPLPYKVITITAGVFHINFLIFCIASALSRSARFFIVAGLFARFGPKIKPFIDKYFNWLCLLFVILLVGGFFIIKYLH